MPMQLSRSSVSITTYSTGGFKGPRTATRAAKADKRGNGPHGVHKRHQTLDGMESLSHTLQSHVPFDSNAQAASQAHCEYGGQRL